MNREAALRDGLVARLERTGILRSPRIAAALRSVDRHRFIPDVSAQEAYEDKALALKERGGTVVSSISQPSIIVHMLELLQVRPNDAVLEIGTGSGYNAALLARLAPGGTVVSVEIEPDLLERARAILDAEGYHRVELTTPERLGAEGRLFDRIVVTARSRDIEPQWWRLLAPGGRLVVPLDIGYGGERAIGFVRDGHRLYSIGSYACAFVALRGVEEAKAEMFFRTPEHRYAGDPGITASLHVIATEREYADGSLLEEADAVIARPHSLFSVRLTS